MPFSGSSKNYVKKFPVYNSVQGRYELSQTENGKNQFRAEFAAASSYVKFLLGLLLRGEPFWILVKLKHGDSVWYMSTTA